MAIVEMLNEEYGFGYEPSRERRDAKKAKVDKFAAYSESLGMVSRGPDLNNEKDGAS